MAKKETIVRESENFTPLVMGGVVSGSNGVKLNLFSWCWWEFFVQYTTISVLCIYSDL